MLMLRLIRWALWLPTWQTAYSAPCDPDAGDHLRAPSTYDDTEDRAVEGRVWIGVNENENRNDRMGVAPLPVGGLCPTGRRNRPRMQAFGCSMRDVLCPVTNRNAAQQCRRTGLRPHRDCRAHHRMERPKQLEGTDMTVHILQNDRAFQTMRDLHSRGFEIGINRRGEGYDLTAYRRETAHGSHERAARVAMPKAWRSPARGPGDGDLPPAA